MMRILMAALLLAGCAHMQPDPIRRGMTVSELEQTWYRMPLSRSCDPEGCWDKYQPAGCFLCDAYDVRTERGRVVYWVGPVSPM